MPRRSRPSGCHDDWFLLAAYNDRLYISNGRGNRLRINRLSAVIIGSGHVIIIIVTVNVD